MWDGCKYGSMVKQLTERRIMDDSTIFWLDGWPKGNFTEREKNVCLRVRVQ